MKKKELLHWKVFHTEKSSVLKSATCQFFHGEFHTIHIHIRIQYSCAQCPILLLLLKFSLALNTHWNEFKWNWMGTQLQLAKCYQKFGRGESNCVSCSSWWDSTKFSNSIIALIDLNQWSSDEFVQIGFKNFKLDLRGI